MEVGDGVTEKRVTLRIDGKDYDVTVDVRESLWETMVYRLGLTSANMGCDRGMCGACGVQVDGRPVYSCVLLTARLGRGETITTVDGLRTGPGYAGLHPIQRAFWRLGAFQCGICTKGFVMATDALLRRCPDPSDADIRRAFAGIVCRCGEYPKIFEAVRAAAAELREETRAAR